VWIVFLGNKSKHINKAIFEPKFVLLNLLGFLSQSRLVLSRRLRNLHTLEGFDAGCVDGNDRPAQGVRD
jgi:hypothetical protein